MSRPRRCAHFVPGGNDKMLTKALATEADALIFDLEDAVTPENKAGARDAVAEWVATAELGRKEAMVRINPPSSPWMAADLEAIMVRPPDSLIIPKVFGPDDVINIDATLGELETRHGHDVGAVSMVVLATETPAALQRIDELACVDRVDALTWGAEDLSAAIGARRKRDDAGRYLPLFESARHLTLIAAAAAGVQPLDTVYTDIGDLDGLRQDCLDAAWIGFTGKLSIHPAQIDIINEVFTPTAEEVARAKALLAELEVQQANGVMAFRFEGEMVDVPHFTQARRLLELHQSLAT